jgi:hypothetical protein
MMSEPTETQESAAAQDTLKNSPPPDPSLGASVDGVHDQLEPEYVPTEKIDWKFWSSPTA